MSMPKKPDISIIIVNYRVQKELFKCIDSIYKTCTDISFEIIVVDNDEVKTLQSPLAKKFPKVIYVPSSKNVGWGSGINIGAKYAKGEYLYLLNPDTILLPHALELLFNFAKENSKLGIIASRLVDFNNKPFYPLGSKELTPLSAMISYTFLEKIFPFSFFASKFFEGVKKGDVTYMEVPPLAASLIKKKVFNAVGGFDKNIFLYFEEFDFGKRLKSKSYVSVIHDRSFVMHAVGASTKKRLDSNQFFKDSRKYYFTKYFGLTTSKILQIFFK